MYPGLSLKFFDQINNFNFSIDSPDSLENIIEKWTPEVYKILIKI